MRNSPINNLLQSGKNEEALQLLDSEGYGDEPDVERLLLKAEILNKIEKYEEAASLCEMIASYVNFEEKPAIYVKTQLTMLNSLIGIEDIRYDMIDELDNVLDIIDGSLPNDESIKSKFYQLRGELFILFGEIEDASADLHNAEFFGRKAGDKLILANILNLLARVNYATGDIEKAFSYLEETYTIASELQNYDRVAKISGNMGILYHARGDLDKAIQYYERAISVFGKSYNKSTAMLVYNNIGSYYNDIGDLNKALEYHFKALQLAEEVQSQIQIAGILNDLGDSYRQFERYEEALQYYNRALKYRERRENKKELADTYLSLVFNYLDMNKLSEATLYCQKINDIPLDDEHFLQLKQLANAMILKHSGRRRNVTKAEEIFSDIIGKEIFAFEHTIIAFRTLCDILIDELIQNKNQEIMDELAMLINKMALLISSTSMS